MTSIFDTLPDPITNKRLEIFKVGEEYRFKLSDGNGIHEIVLDRNVATFLMMRLMHHVHDNPKETRHESIS